MITVDELFKLWLHNKNPKSKVMVWDKKIFDYIFSSDDLQKYDTSAEEVGKLKVSCFYSYYDKNKDIDVLSINVDTNER